MPPTYMANPSYTSQMYHIDKNNRNIRKFSGHVYHNVSCKSPVPGRVDKRPQPCIKKLHGKRQE